MQKEEEQRAVSTNMASSTNHQPQSLSVSNDHQQLSSNQQSTVDRQLEIKQTSLVRQSGIG